MNVMYMFFNILERYFLVFNRCDCGLIYFDFVKKCKVVVIIEKGIRNVKILYFGVEIYYFRKRLL